jgi:hypothetical protein
MQALSGAPIPDWYNLWTMGRWNLTSFYLVCPRFIRFQRPRRYGKNRCILSTGLLIMYLPPELMSMIGSHCGRDYVKLLRHIDRQFYNVVNPLLFEYITICYARQKQAECLDILAQNPYIRECIRRLT